MLNMIDYLTEEEMFKVIDICQEFINGINRNDIYNLILNYDSAIMKKKFKEAATMELALYYIYHYAKRKCKRISPRKIQNKK